MDTFFDDNIGLTDLSESELNTIDGGRGIMAAIAYSLHKAIDEAWGEYSRDPEYFMVTHTR
jgi:hypothetical protein